MKLVYPACFYQDEETKQYTVEVPDLPGCVTGGQTLADAILMAQDAASGWVLGEYDRGMEKRVDTIYGIMYTIYRRYRECRNGINLSHGFCLFPTICVLQRCKKSWKVMVTQCERPKEAAVILHSVNKAVLQLRFRSINRLKKPIWKWSVQHRRRGVGR